MKLAKIINGLVIAGMVMPAAGLAMGLSQQSQENKEYLIDVTNMEPQSAAKKIVTAQLGQMQLEFEGIENRETDIDSKLTSLNKLQVKFVEIVSYKPYRSHLQDDNKTKVKTLATDIGNFKKALKSQHQENGGFAAQSNHLLQLQQRDLDEDLQVALAISQLEANEREQKAQAAQPAVQPQAAQFQGQAARLDVNPLAQPAVPEPEIVQLDPAFQGNWLTRNWKSISIALSAAVLTALGAWWWFKKHNNTMRII